MPTECPACHFENPEDTNFCGKCSSPLKQGEEATEIFTKTLDTPPVIGLQRGMTFAERYEVIEELGKGGMGKVYKVIDTEINTEVALKLIKAEITEDERTIERFRNELKIAREISHKNVCRMFDLNKEKGTYYITMEFVAGQDLKGLIRQSGQLAIGTTIRIAKQIASGLAEAHRMGIIHRDLKPSNILIDKEGQAKIMDFGIAQSIKTKSITGSGMMVGTPEYMSPEQAEAKKLDLRSDIYSFGIILYKMVTGVLPFEGDTPLSVAMKHKSEIPSDPRAKNALVSEDLSRLILKCLEKEKENRYQDAEEILEELAAIEEGLPTPSKGLAKRRTKTSREITVSVSRKKLIIPAAAVVMLVAAAFIILNVMPKKPSVIIDPDKPSVAILYFKNNTGDEGLDHWKSALATWLITDLSQSKYIDVTPEDVLFGIFRKLKLLDANGYSVEDLEKIASEARASHIFQASYSKAANTYRIDYSLRSMKTMEPIKSDSIEGEWEESFPNMVDGLTQKIKSNLEFSKKVIARDIDEDIENITTSTPEAYRLYAEGRKSHMKGDSDPARAFYKQAIELDPNFAMAYRALAAVGGEGYRENFTKAFELRDRVSEKERFIIEGDFFRSVEIDYTKALEAYKKLLTLYPDDFGGNHNIAITYINLGEYEKSIQYTEFAHQKNKASVPTVYNLTNGYAHLGYFDKAVECLQDYLENVSDNYLIYQLLSEIYTKAGKFDLALEEADKLAELNPTRRSHHWAYYLKGDYAAAEREYQLMLEIRNAVAIRTYVQNLYITQGQLEKAEVENKEAIKQAEESSSYSDKTWIPWLYVELSKISLLRGNAEEALKNVNMGFAEALELKSEAHQRNALNTKVSVYLEMNDIDEAQRAASEIEEMIKKSGKPHDANYRMVIGLIDLEIGNFDQAIKYIREAISLNGSCLEMTPVIYVDALASAYFKAKDFKQALREYEKIQRITWGRSQSGYIYAKSFYMLGIINEEMGNSTEAIEHYEKFLTLWKDADPGIPEVEDATERLAGLKE
ncbi:protein kinase [Acidobacteriota bacterium]